MKAEQKKHIIQNTFYYTASRYIAQGVNFAGAILMRRYVGPFGIGVWSLLKVVRDYTVYTDFGTPLAVTYKYPFLIGKDDRQSAEDVKNTVYNFVMLTTFLSSGLLLAYAFICKRALSREVFYGFIFLSVILIFQRIFTYYMVLLRATKDFSTLSKAMIFDSLVNISCVFILMRAFKFYGLLATILLLPVINNIFIAFFSRIRLKFSFNMRGIVSYIKFSFPLFLNNILRGVFVSVDKIIVVSLLGIENLGLYSIAFMTKTYSLDIYNNFGHVILPYFFEDYGRHNSQDRVFKFMKIVTLSTSYFMAMLLSFVYILAPVCITYILPKFIPGIAAMKIFLFTTFFTSISEYLENCFVALNKQVVLFKIMFVAIAANIALNLVFIRFNFGFTGVALGTAISSFLAFLVMVIYPLLRVESLKQIALFILKVLLPLVYSIVSVFLLEHFLVLNNPILGVITKSFVFLVLSLPLLYLFNKETGLIRECLKVLKDKIKHG